MLLEKEIHKEIKHLIQISTLRDVQIKLKEAQIDGQIIPDTVFEIIKNLEDTYKLTKNNELETQ